MAELEQKKVEHYSSNCSFCNKQLTFTVKDGKKALDKPCDCRASKEYYSPAETAKRKAAEEKELERIEIAQGKREAKAA